MLYYVPRDAELARDQKTSYLSKNVIMKPYIPPLILIIIMILLSWGATELRYRYQGDRQDWMIEKERPCENCMSIPEKKMRKGMIAVEQADGSIKTTIVEISEEEYQKIQSLTH